MRQAQQAKAAGVEGKTWEFVCHRFATPARWTWTHVTRAGRTMRKSRVSHPSLASAVIEATICGFNAFEDVYQVIELD
jgi:hypothetical protein